MTILQTKEVMQNLEKSPSDTPLTMKEVEILIPLEQTLSYTISTSTLDTISSTYQLTISA